MGALGGLMIEQVLKFLTAALPIVRKVLDRGRRVKHIEMLQAHEDLYRIMRDLRLDAEACRVLVLRSTNGGGIPDVGQRTWIEVVHESCADDIGSMIDFRRRTDEFDAGLLRELVRTQVINIGVEDMPQGELLDRHTAEGFVRTYVFPIALDPKKATYYGSISFRDDPADEQEDSRRRVAIATGAQRIRDVFVERGYVQFG